MSYGIKGAIISIVGISNVIDTEEGASVYSFDASGLSGAADIVCFPPDIESLSRLLSLCYNEGVYIYPRGAGSGRTGACIPVCSPNVVISFERMNRIIEVSREDMIARAEPGVITRDIQKAVEGAGLFYPPDPASASFSTIGGNVATNAGGIRAVKYGVTRDYVIGINALSPDGERLYTGGSTVKSSVGYDINDLLVGSEGTLSIFTEITLKLLPLPKYLGVILAIFNGEEVALRAVNAILTAGILPRSIEFMDKTCSYIVLKGRNYDSSKNAPSILLMEFDGNEEAVRIDMAQVKGLLKNDFSATVVVKGKDAAGELWSIRRSLSQRVRELGYPHKISEDIVVPRGKIRDALLCLGAIEDAFNGSSGSSIKIVCFGHAGDGNLHVNILCDLNREGNKIEQVVKEIFDMALGLGGRISGEHGIGIMKKPYLTSDIKGAQYKIMQEIKGIFDPKGLLNAGKLFPERQKDK